MNHIHESQEGALLAAIGFAAEYLQECGTTDLAALTHEQAIEFARVLVCRYGEQDFIPF